MRAKLLILDLEGCSVFGRRSGLYLGGEEADRPKVTLLHTGSPKKECVLYDRRSGEIFHYNLWWSVM